VSILPGSAARAAVESAVADGGERVAARLRTLQCEAVDNAAPSAAANLPAIIVFAFIVRRAVPAVDLYVWIGTALIVLTGVVLFSYNALPARLRAERASDRLIIHGCLATLVGGLWGGAALAFGPLLGESRMMVFTLMVLVCNAACISGIGPYLPAFAGYCLASTLPLAVALFRRSEIEAHTMALLVPLYIAVIGANARAYNRQVLSAFRLRADNEALAENLAKANVATAEARRSKWNTLAHLSHELRTPMNAIMGFSQMMRDQIFEPLADRYRDYSGHIHESGHHMLDLIDTILDVSRAEAGQLTIEESEFAPGALVEECLTKARTAAAAKFLTLEIRSESRMPLIMADRAKLRQALLNLLSNAVKYTRDGGRIAIRLSCDDDGMGIAITDNGVGIAPGDLEKCQEPFVRVESPLIATAEGAGLGLPLARRFAEAHGGQFRLTSELGHGTTATILLPPERCVWHDGERRRA
jgi:two-component system, cell cycle sensor histidine kinase PleC